MLAGSTGPVDWTLVSVALVAETIVQWNAYRVPCEIAAVSADRILDKENTLP